LEEVRKTLNVPDNIEDTEDFESILNYLEDNYFKDIREDEIMATYEQTQKEQEKYIENLMDIDMNMEDEKQIFISEYNVLCPVCEEALIEIEELINPNNDKQLLRIYNCICGAQFQCANPLVKNAQSNESSQEQVKSLLSNLKERLNQIWFYHQQHNKCSQKLLFRVEPDKKYLQCWCNSCNYNDLVV